MMVLSDWIKNFIKFNKKRINLNQWEDLYADLSSFEFSNGIELLGEFTIAMHSAKLYPETYLDYLPYGFLNSTGIRKYIVPDNIKSIGQFAFRDCYDLEQVVIPKSVEQIDCQAFFNCSDITSILYYGTKNDFIKIESQKNPFADSYDVIIECNDGNLTWEDLQQIYES